MIEPKEFLGRIDDGRILDVATGYGSFIHFLVDGLRSFDEIIGIDTSERGAGQFAAAFQDQNIHFIKMDARRLGFPNSYFDLVCVSNSLHHLAALPRVITEMKRVLKPGGFFLVAEMYRDGQTETQMTHVHLHDWWAAGDRALGVLHYETYTRQQIIDLLEPFGLKNVSCADIKDLSNDPKDPDMLAELGKAIDRYQERLRSLPSPDPLLQRGEELRQRLAKVGFHSATTLIYLGSNS